MARVFRGKIAIPGEEMDAYLEALGQFEREKAPLRTQLEQYAGDFARTLAQQYAPKTVRKHTAIIGLFLEFSSAGRPMCSTSRRLRVGWPIVRFGSGTSGKWAIGRRVN